MALKRYYNHYYITETKPNLYRTISKVTDVKPKSVCHSIFASKI